ncbi:MAG TPA: hypothetical protein VMP89_00965 [Solirubrobacteraceae bacterium]|nr:hypothetical protein [Solirubrobacteraceae bacterium]
MSRTKAVVGVVTLAVAAFAGGAYAATNSDTNPRQAFLNDVAKRLNVSPQQLSAAFKAAFIDRLDAAVKAGKITQAQADRIKQRIQNGGPVPFPIGPRLVRPHGFGRGGTIGAAATYLGITDAQLLADLRRGETLAQIARAHGKSASGLQAAITSAMKTRLDRLVADGSITRAQENQILSRLSARIANRVNRPLLREWHGGQRPRLAAPSPGGPPAPGPSLTPPPPPGPPPAA